MAIVTLPYVDMRTEQLSATNSHRFTQQWRCTSIFDPQVAAGGHQPLGHDQWRTFYERYTVLSCTISVRITHVQSEQFVLDNPPQLICALNLVRQEQVVQVVGAPIETITENPNTQWMILNDAGASNAQKAMRRRYNARRFWKLNPLTDELLNAGFGANPGREARFVLTVENRSGGVLEVDDFVITTRLRYTVACRYPTPLAAS